MDSRIAFFYKFLVLILVVLSSSFAQGLPTKLKYKQELVVPSKAKLHKRIVFLIDSSGSMYAENFQRAVRAVLWIAEQPIDEMEIKVISFNDKYKVWPGYFKKTKKEKKFNGWTKLPSKKAINSLRNWLIKSNQPGGGTYILPALKLAFKMSAKMKDISVVIISDGIFGDPIQCCLSHNSNYYIAMARHFGILLDRTNIKRKKDKLNPITIGIFGIGKPQEHFKRIAKKGHGPYMAEYLAPVKTSK